MNEEILLRQNENGEFEPYEPYATIEIDTEEDFDKIKSAIEKQRAEKPFEVNEKVPYITWKCPICGKRHTTVEKVNHCDNCGQKIDWTGAEG